MNGLLSQRGDAPGCGGEGLTHALARGSSNHVVAIERGLQSDGGEKILSELGAKLAQFIEGEIAQLDSLLNGEAHGIADLFVRGAEWNALVNEISCRGHCIQ